MLDNKALGFRVWGIGLLFAFSVPFSAPVNSKIQEAAYILNVEADTARAEQMLVSALDSENATQKEKLNASLYLAKIAEAKKDSAKAGEYYRFLKNNARSSSLAYTASEKERLWSAKGERIKIARVEQGAEQNLNTQTPIDSMYSHCKPEGELYLAQRMVYNCPDNLLYLVSKKNGKVWSVLFTGAPAKVFLVFNGFFLYSENTLSFYSLKDGLLEESTYVWRIPTLEIQDIDNRESQIFVLDISGQISLLDKNSGQKISSAKSDGEALFMAGTGLVGTYQKNGGISVFDSLLTHLWDYQIDGEILERPVLKGDSVIFNLSNGNAEILHTRHYQKFSWPVLADMDSIFSLESGNANAWYKLALQKNTDSLWNKAIIYGARRPELSELVFAEYAKKIGAKWIKRLHISSNMHYPKILSDGSRLFVLDANSKELLNFSLENGFAGASIVLPKDGRLVSNDSPLLMLNSGNRLSLFSLKEQKAVSLGIPPGDPISFLRNKDSLYIGSVNGFALKYYVPEARLEWSRKVSSAPVFLGLGDEGIYSLSQGKINSLSQKKQDKKINMESNGMINFKFKNGIFTVASPEGLVQVYSEKDFSMLGTFSIDSDITSFELVEYEGKTYALAGTANQSLSLFEIPSGKLSWTFSSRGSAFMQAIPNASHIWLDQDNSIAAIDISTGKLVKKHKILGSGASIFIHGNTLYSATPQKLLYAFPID
jgi:hypothetical protein